MGGVVSSHSTVPDPETGLSPRDKYLVSSTWAAASKNLKAIGFALFEKLFIKNPGAKDLFVFTKGKTWEEITQEKRMIGHVNSIMYAFSSLVDNLNDIPVFEATAQKIAENHYRRKITVETFKALGPILIETLLDKLGPRVMTADAQTAWGKTYDVLLKIIDEHQTKCASNQNQE